MHRDLKIIGDRIEFMGYHVGTLTDIAPASIREDFERRLEPARGYYPAMYNAPKVTPRKAKR